MKPNSPSLGESYIQAERRFLSLERRLKGNVTLEQQYKAFMKDYCDLNHMTELPNPDRNRGYYIPHHGVTNMNSSTTKFRAVFDASAKTSTGVSLNDVQFVGPTVQSDLFTILLRFRRHEIAVCADIEKMYRQVSVTPTDRHMHKILWRDDPSQPLKTYQLNTVTYGTAAAPFLATISLNELAIQHEKTHPKASAVIQKDFYVDDLCSGATSINEAYQLFTDVRAILDSAGFPLRKWASNSVELLKKLQPSEIGAPYLVFGSDTTSRTLGIQWAWKPNEFQYNVQIMQCPEKMTKRTILSSIAKLFDPLGLVSPITVRAKMLLQQLWIDKLDWDESLSTELYMDWQQFFNDINKMTAIRISRRILADRYTSLELHGFSDASKRAYGACIYVRTENHSCTMVRLLCSKTKVAPLKPLTIPKLELSAALMLAKLMVKVVNVLNLNVNNCVLWSDSTMVLAWLNRLPLTLKTFVRNRVCTIQTLTSSYKWNHVPTKDNPADCLSRGSDAHALLHSSHIWWCGPKWLAESETNWPHSTTCSQMKKTCQKPKM